MKKTLYLFLIVSNFINAQNLNLDSLQTKIDNIKEIDTNSISTRTFYLKELIFKDPSRIDLMVFANETFRLSKELNYKKGIVITNQHLGIIYQFFKNDPLKAIEHYQKALEIIDKKPYLREYSVSSLNNLGSIYLNREEYKKALQSYKKSYQIAPNSPIITEQYLGLIYGNLKKIDSAVFYLKKAIDKSSNQKNYIVLANSYSNLAKVLLDNNQLEEAIKNIEKALILYENYNLSMITIPLYANATEIYLFNKNYKKAEYYAQKLKEEPQVINSIYIQKSIYATLFEVYYNKKQYKNALEAHILFKKYNDSLISIDDRVAITKKDLELEAERKELLTNAEIAKQKFFNNLYLISGIFIVFTLLLIFYILNQRRKTKVAFDKAILNTNNIKFKLVALKSQLNPHFIFNALNSINQYIVNNDTKEASNYLIKFSRLMRGVLQNSEKNWVLLSEELELMKRYVEIESLRLRNLLLFEISIDDEIDEENTLVPSLFIQPFIENSIKHGIAKKETQGKIKIIINKVNDEKLVCIVEDDGIGRSDASKKAISSYGIKIAKQRIEYINQLTGIESSFKIEDLNQGVKVSITIPFNKKF